MKKVPNTTDWFFPEDWHDDTFSKDWREQLGNYDGHAWYFTQSNNDPVIVSRTGVLL